MTSQEAAARFAAFNWYLECRRTPTKTIQTEADRFTRENWQTFLPVANEGFGRLLLRVANRREERARRSTDLLPG